MRRRKEEDEEDDDGRGYADDARVLEGGGNPEIIILSFIHVVGCPHIHFLHRISCRELYQGRTMTADTFHLRQRE